MRVLVLAVFALGAAILAPHSGGAQYAAEFFPYCAHYFDKGGSSNCYFSSLEQCRAAVSGVGGYCNGNPWFVPPVQMVRPRKSRPHPLYY
jgi:Protein of unknown function (DUF3551)